MHGLLIIAQIVLAQFPCGAVDGSGFGIGDIVSGQREVIGSGRRDFLLLPHLIHCRDQIGQQLQLLSGLHTRRT